jgi:hypothetical protein
MRTSAHARFAITRWDESTYNDGPPKLTRASVTRTLTGDIEGEGRIEYLMMYRTDGSATFVGLERVTATLGGRSGGFILQRTGIFEGGRAIESYFVVPGSATGELSGLQGDGTSSAGHGLEHPFLLDYEFGEVQT